MNRILSGIQPSGELHLGNYLGFIKNNINFISAERCEAFLFIADLHAITVPQDPAMLNKSTIEVAALYHACGLNEDICHLFVQSQILEHAELSWILGCYTSLGWLNRMTQFKEKSEKYKAENASLGLYSYPVLMAADILIYQADYVTVGDDQKQHVELARDIAGAFNNRTSTNFFKLPQPEIIKSSGRIMSLRDGTKKMSKSDESDYSRINLLDSPDEIQQKIKKAKTDATKGLSYDSENRPEITNLINIYAGLSGISIKDLLEQKANSSCAEFKNELAELIIDKLSPIRDRFNDVMRNQDYIKEILQKGQDAARAVASCTLKQAKEIVGFLSF